MESLMREMKTNLSVHTEFPDSFPYEPKFQTWDTSNTAPGLEAVIRMKMASN